MGGGINMEWYVFYHDMSKREITTFNIFHHYNFNKDVIRDLKQVKNKDEFAKKLKSNLQYYFWCKSEFEVLISPWCGGMGTEDVKIDIYTQVMNNWDVFLDYCWNSKNRRNEKKATETIGYADQSGLAYAT